MNVSEYLRNHLRTLGFHVPEKANRRGKILIFFAIFFALETLNAVLTNWHNVHLRFLALEDLNVTAAMCGLYLDYGVKPKHVDALLTLSEEDFFQYTNVELSKEKKETMEDCKRMEKVWAEKVAIAVKIFVLNIILVKIVIRLIMLIPKEVTSAEELPFFFEFIYPFNYSSWRIYCLVFLLQFVYVLSIHPLANCVYSSGVLVMNRMCAEVKLLTISLDEIDQKFRPESGFVEPFKNDLHLKIYTRQIIQHHQAILRKMGQLNRGIAITASLVNEVICFISCLSLYYFIEVADIILKLKAISTLFVVLFLLFLYTSYGQNLLNQGDDLRNALFNCCWVDKPHWFKSSLNVMMTCANRPIVVNPFGLYVVNLKNYSAIVNAAYSFFNFLKTVHKG